MGPGSMTSWQRRPEAWRSAQVGASGGTLGSRTLTFHIVVLLCTLLVAGCGFEPLMARSTTNAAADDLNRIRVLTIADRSGQILRNQLLDDFDSRRDQGPPLYSLEVKLAEPRQEIAIRRDESASRVSYTANASFILRDGTGQAIFGGYSSSTSTYEATSSEFASISGQRGARDRAMQEISADIRQQLTAYFYRVRRIDKAPTP